MITIDYFSDVLCVWAYGGQVRLEELQREFKDDVLVRQRFMPLFADTRTRIGEGWKDKGGFAGFGSQMREVCGQWEHTRLHPDVWIACRPASCTTSHVFLKAVHLCLGLEQAQGDPDAESHALFDRLVARTRKAFFEEARDVANLAVLMELLAATGLSPGPVKEAIDNGQAYAVLRGDELLASKHGVLGSPTFVFNDGRQLLYGNVGYRIVASNVRELMSSGHVEGEPSWC